MVEWILYGVVAVLAYLGLCGYAGVYVAQQKGRDEKEGATLGVLFGPLGILIEACLPTQDERSS